MNRIIALVFTCVLATSLACRHNTAGLPVGGPDAGGVSKDVPPGNEKIAFQVIGMMKTKSGAT